ncbi:MAG: lytic transglycosylase domain-containing protein [Chromatiales bacterium]|nr:lytic transglycosylase domain-containing protein [Chromatiales bacterium]
MEKQRALYLKTEQALKQGQRNRFLQFQNSLRNYPLYPYLLYTDMRKRFAYLQPETIDDFLSRYDNTPIADKLRYKWLQYLAAKNNKQLFARYYRNNKQYLNNELMCFYAQSLLHAKRVTELRDLTRQLWLVDFSQPTECDPIFQWGKKTKVIDQNLIWQRIILVVKNNNIGLADYLARQLNTDYRLWYALLKQGHYHPFRALARIADHQTHSALLHQILLYSLSQAQAQDLNKAHAVWQNLKPRFRSYASLYEQASTALGIAACRQLKPEIGLGYLSLIKHSDKESNYWHIRCALRLQKWKNVLAAIAALDHQDRTNTRWLYWKARALEQLGNRTEAKMIWKDIASEASYYGYLAADRVNQAYALSTKLPIVEPRIINQTKDLAAMKRTYEFFSIGRIFDARRELFYLLPRLNKDERIATALLCRQWGQATCVIEALADKSFWHQQLELRFPMPYRDIVAQQASIVDLSEHWLYAVMRRESAFMADVKSSAGALGLMQLMPATAAKTAKRLGLKHPSTWALLKPKLNIQLGSHYLNRVYLLNNRKWELALASYNAGYHRVKQWQAKAPVDDADIWIETIPFTETRRYVRAVLFYTVVYYYKMHNKMIRLRALIV